VDPYSLTYKAEQLGHHPQMILAGRRINDHMAEYVCSQIIKNMLAKKIQPMDSRVLVMGLTFKENCPDVRNTKVVDIVSEMTTYGASVDVWDPWVDAAEARAEYGIDLVTEPEKGAYDVVVIAVAHDQFRKLGEQGIRGFGKETSVVYDIKYVLPTDAVDDRL
jgi:UDP-N-acetyl-D-galactosamine dehydrogenase